MNTLFVSTLNVNTFASRILELIKDKKNLKTVGEQAYKDLYFTWSEIVERLEEIYTEEIEKNQKRLEEKIAKRNAKHKKSI